jgi:SnoaL-like domain
MTSKVKRRAGKRSLFDPPGHGFRLNSAQIRARIGAYPNAFWRFMKPDWRKTMLDAQALADRYVAAWNEPDAIKRSCAIAALWAPDALPHQRAREARGYGALSKLILGVNRNAAQEGVRFRAAPSARQQRDVVTFRWEMLLTESETVLASGLEFLIVNDDGRILVDHPFAPA